MSETTNNRLVTAKQKALACRRLQKALILSNLPQAEKAPKLHPAWQSCVNRHQIRDLAVQDNKLWAATTGGVIRWQVNGSKIKYTHYTSEHGLPGNASEHIIVDGAGHPWVAGRRTGLSYYDGSFWRILEDQMLPTADILSLSVDTDGTLWVGTTMGLGSIHWHGEKEQWRSFDLSHAPLPLPEVRALALDDQRGVLWLGTMWGLYGYSFKMNSWQHLTQRDGLRDSSISCLHTASNGTLWIGTISGLNILQQGRIKVVPAITELVKSIALDPITESMWLVAGENLWLGSNGEWKPVGIEACSLIEIGTSQAEVVATDGKGSVWAGFQDSLVQCKPKKRLLSVPKHGELAASGIQALTIDSQGRVWVGSIAGLWIYENEHWRCCRLGSEVEFPLESIAQIVPLSKDEVWVNSWSSGENGGLRRFVGATEVPILNQAPASIDVLTSDVNDNLWAISGDKVWFFNGTSWVVITTLPDPILLAQTLLATEQGTLYLGEQFGLHRHENGTWTECLPQIEVNTLVQTYANVLWIGTTDGLHMITDEGNLSLSDQTTDLPAQEITALAVSPEIGLWIGTTQGLALLTDDEIKVWNTRNSGLTHNHILALAASEDGVWIGTVNGVSWFDWSHKESKK